MAWICPECGCNSDRGDAPCPECGGAVEEVDAAPPGWRSLAAVYRAPDEIAAIAVGHVLESAGITPWLRSIQIPWYDSIMKVARGYWGDVLVADEDRERAVRVVGEYLARVDGV
jgi:hypothetical protein